MKVFACYNVKGGVGKTTTAVNLAYLSAKSGKKTLLWDVDLQGSATLLLHTPNGKVKSVRVLSESPKKAKSHIYDTPFKNLDILPADFSLHKLDHEVRELNKPNKQIKSILATFEKKYDNVFIDCPAGYSSFTQALQQIVDVFLIPIVPSPLTMKSYELFKQRLKKNAKKNLIVFPFFSMVDRRKQLHKEIITLHRNGKRGFLHGHIPASSHVERMAVEMAPLFSFGKNSAAARAYKGLWDEINTNIEMYDRVKKIKMW